MEKVFVSYLGVCDVIASFDDFLLVEDVNGVRNRVDLALCEPVDEMDGVVVNQNGDVVSGDE